MAFVGFKMYIGNGAILVMVLANCSCMTSLMQPDCKNNEENTSFVQVYCTVPFLKPDVNLSSIPINRAVILTILCSQKSARSSINSTTFHDLAQVQRLFITECKFEELPEEAFQGLQNLQRLTIQSAYNPESSLRLPSQFSEDLGNITVFTLQGTGIKTIPNTMWHKLPRLRELWLAYNKINKLDLLNDLANSGISLDVLDLSFNLLTMLPPHAFAMQPTLTKLHLDNNTIAVIHQDSFKDLHSLAFLLLPLNNLTVLPSIVFHQLNKLQILDLFGNNIASFPAGVFSGLSKLHLLQLANNNLSHFPDAPFRDLVQLQRLHLKNNSISSLSCSIFYGLENVYTLDLSYNDLSNVCDSSFLPVVNTLQLLDISYTKSQNLNYIRNVSSLIKLYAGNNLLKGIPYNSIEKSKGTLEYINLQQTSITTLVRNDKKWGENAIFSDFPQLQQLILVSNWINQFDYFMVPTSLTYLDLTNNRINSLEDVFSVRSAKKITTIVLNRNAFPQLDSHSFPQSIKTIICNDCSIKVIRQGTFGNLSRLKRITLMSSNVRSVERFAFSIVPGKATITPAVFFNSKQCHLASEAIVSNIHFEHFYQDGVKSQGKSSKYICQMTGYCNSNSGNKVDHQCNKQNTSNQQVTTWPNFSNFVIMDCGYNNISEFNFVLKSFAEITMLYLDGNQIKTLYNNSFTNFTSLQFLFVNNSRITSLESGTFTALHELQELYLNNNELKSLCARQFFHLQKLSAVFLQNNYIAWLDFKVLSGVSQLKYLNLDNNRFFLLNGFAFHSVAGLQNLTLANNNMTKIGKYSFTVQNQLLELNLQNNSLETFSPKYLVATKRLKKLLLSNNKLCVIQPHTFSHSIELQELHLQRNLITGLGSLTFFPLNHLRVLHLEQNQLVNLNGNLFRGSFLLEELHLNGNNLVEIGNDDFTGAYILKTLYIHNNYLKSINSDALSSLSALKVLTLHNNHLTGLDVWKLPANLEEVSLSGNDFPCDCSFLIPFQNWILGPEGNNKVTDIDNVVCKHKNGTSATVSVIRYTQRFCQTHVSVLAITLISGGCFVTLIVMSVLVYLHRLEMKVWFYSHYGLRLFYKGNNADFGRVYHGFVSYSNNDEDFVDEELVRYLEPEFNLCIHGRDFPVGAYIIDTVCDVVEKSCRTILVLSNNFLNSEWCRFEFKIAHHQTMKDRCCRLIVILMEDIDVNQLDRELKVYLKTNTYLKWGDRFFWEKLRYAMPDVQRLHQYEEQQPLLGD